jgi:CheY-like chemotaxis protein
MNVLTIDDEAGALEVLNRAVLEAVPNAKLQAFTSAVDALEAIRRGNALPDVAFLDVKMPGMTGLEMAKCVKDLSPCTRTSSLSPPIPSYVPRRDFPAGQRLCAEARHRRG